MRIPEPHVLLQADHGSHAEQALQCSAEDVGTSVAPNSSPAVHAAHDAWPSETAMLPTAQAVHALGETSPVVALDVPAAHGVHVECGAAWAVR